MESKHELGKTAAGNLCSGIQDTGNCYLGGQQAMGVSPAFQIAPRHCLLLLAETYFFPP